MSFLFQCIYKNAKIKCIELLFLSYQFAAIRLDYRCATPVFFLKTIKRLYKTFSKRFVTFPIWVLGWHHILIVFLGLSYLAVNTDTFFSLLKQKKTVTVGPFEECVPSVWGRKGDSVNFPQLLWALKQLSLMHSGGKPYECDQCKYSSKMAQNLKTHKLTHSGEKPYACDQCKYSSKTAQNLKTHKLTHSGEKPYACD